ncbi:MAG: diguanylate cyclase [Candidatus Hydrothermales bacterium]
MSISSNFTLKIQKLKRFISERKLDSFLIFLSFLLLSSSLYTSKFEIAISPIVSILILFILIFFVILNFLNISFGLKEITLKLLIFSAFNFLSFLYKTYFNLLSFLFILIFFGSPFLILFFSFFPILITIEENVFYSFAFFLYSLFLFILLYREKRRNLLLKEEIEKVSSKLRLFEIEKVPSEKLIKELKKEVYPEKPVPLFKFALNHLKEVYSEIILPNSLAFLFYDPLAQGFRIETSYSKKKFFKNKGIIPLYSPLIKLATEKNERIYFPEFSGSGYDIGLYESNIKLGSICIVPIFSEGDLYGFIYADKEEIKGFSENDLKFLDFLSKETNLFLKFFILLKNENQLASRFRALFELAKDTAGKLRLKEVAEKIIYVSEILKKSDVICLLEKRSDEIRCIAINQEKDWIKTGSKFIHSEDSIISLLFKSGFPVFTGRIKSSIPVIGKINPDIKSILAFPIKIEGKARYALALFSRHLDYFDEKDKEIFEFLIQQAQISIEKALLFEKTLDLAIRDSLTGLYNHKTFQEKLLDSIKRNIPFSLILIDVDLFKKINDTYGHPFGDKVLMKIAEILKEETEKIGIPARYGGEEFALIIEGSKEYARYKGEEIRKRIEKEEFYTDEGERVYITVSMGIASFPLDTKERGSLIEKADRALYIAKRSGRNRVISWGQEEISP